MALQKCWLFTDQLCFKWSRLLWLTRCRFLLPSRKAFIRYAIRFFLNEALRLLLVVYKQNITSIPIYCLRTDVDHGVTFSLKSLQFEVLLAPLYALIREVEREQLRGGRLLNLLHAKCHCGIPELQACMQRSVYFIVRALQLPVECYDTIYLEMILMACALQHED